MKNVFKVVLFAAAVALTGCAASVDGGFKEVDCTGVYLVKTFPLNDKYPVKINAVRQNRFGEKYYRISPSQRYVTFAHRWQSEDKFEIVECNNE
ncbi:TPA: hypothetical protein NU305_001298 [Escherichia coli]|nr:hypothetical protein [Escherichia coli]